MGLRRLEARRGLTEFNGKRFERGGLKFAKGATASCVDAVYDGSSFHEVSVRELWDKTWKSLRRYPALCLPVVWASLLAYGWAKLRMMCIHEMPTLLLRTYSQSVLTDSMVGYAQPGSAQYFGVLFLTGFVSLACLFSIVCCFFVALMTTVKMLQRYTIGTSPVRLMSWRLIGLSAGFYVMGSLCFALAFAATYQLGLHVHKDYLFTQNSVLGLQVGLVGVVLSYLLAPAALQLVAKSCGHVVTDGADKGARVCAIITAVTLTVIEVAARRLRVTGQFSPLEAVLANLFITVATALPYIPFFVAMGLLALDGPVEKPGAETPSLVEPVPAG
jgi:hypothetical protein